MFLISIVCFCCWNIVQTVLFLGSLHKCISTPNHFSKSGCLGRIEAYPMIIGRLGLWNWITARVFPDREVL
ncbi:hypothetical protein BZA70DRAFT_60294 [Myxozyma melibiosi]|uniref:Secreted protein n=1 Tax=Myxozyma melibiosi TaxID=54550 RepID=A0ABR1F1R6_9ASCO